MKEKVKQILKDTFPVYQENSVINLDSIKKMLPQEEPTSVWQVVLTLADLKLIKIDDGLTANITVLPKFYE